MIFLFPDCQRLLFSIVIEALVKEVAFSITPLLRFREQMRYLIIRQS